MTDMQFEREMRYRTVMAVARSMLNRGLISKEEYEDFDREMIEKLNPPISNLAHGLDGRLVMNRIS